MSADKNSRQYLLLERTHSKPRRCDSAKICTATKPKKNTKAQSKKVKISFKKIIFQNFAWNAGKFKEQY